MKKYIDFSFLQNPLFNYVKWLIVKIFYQTKYWGKHLRIGYLNSISNVQFGRYNWSGKNVMIRNAVIGNYSYFSAGSVILNCDMGAFCSIGPNVLVAPGKHPTHTYVSTYPSFFYNPDNLLNNFVNRKIFENTEKVVIGNDVWIGANCVIIDGVVIGNGAIIAANSVVTKDVEDYSIVGGVPAKVIRKRFTDDQINTLSKSKWWDKDDNWLKENVSSFWNIENFVTRL